MALDLNPYQAARRGIRNQYQSQMAQNDYARTISQQRGQRQIADYRRDWTRTVPQFTSGYGQRGLAGPGVRSGVYARAMNQYLGDYERNRGRMQQDYTTNMNEFRLRGGQLGAEKEQALADVQARKARDMALAGVYLKNLRPLYGGG